MGGAIAQRKAAAAAADSGAAPTTLGSAWPGELSGRPAIAGPPRSARRVNLLPSSVASTLPFRSVRYTWAPRASIRASVWGAGWPYGFTAPTDTIAARGRTASRNASVDEVRLP